MAYPKKYADPAMARFCKRYDADRCDGPTLRRDPYVGFTRPGQRPRRLQNFHDTYAPVVIEDRAIRLSRRHPHDRRWDVQRNRDDHHKKQRQRLLDAGWGDWLRVRLSNRRLARLDKHKYEYCQPLPSPTLSPRREQHAPRGNNRPKRSGVPTAARVPDRRQGNRDHRPRAPRKRQAHSGQRQHRQTRSRRHDHPTLNYARSTHRRPSRNRNNQDIVPILPRASGKEVCQLSRRHPHDRPCRPIVY